MRLFVKRNAVWAAAEVVVSGLALFILYKFVLVHVGIEGVGLWSLLVAVTSFGRVADIGAGTGLSQNLARSLAKGDLESANSFVNSAFIINLILYSSIGILLYVVLYQTLDLWVLRDFSSISRSLLPYTVVILVLSSLSATALAALVGQHRTDLKSLITVSGLLVQIIVAVILVPRLGLIGLAISQIAQHIVYVSSARIVTFFLFRRIGFVGRGTYFNKKTAYELIRFGSKLHGLNLVMFVFEPATKYAVSAALGVSVLGTFELAYRMVVQVRHIAAAPTQALGPAFTHLTVTDSHAARSMYDRAITSMTLIGGLIYFGVIIASPMISLLWLSYIDYDFVWMTLLFSVGWYLNLLCAPNFVFAVSQNYVRWNLFGAAVTSLAGPLLAYFGGIVSGSIAAAAGSMLALSVGSTIILVANGYALRLRCWPSWALIIVFLRNFRNDILRFCKGKMQL